MPVELKVPEVGESITEVYIGEWHKSVGDRVERDEDVVELESEKATFDAPAPAAGKLSKILKQSGESAEVGEVIAYIDEDGAEAAGEEEREPAHTERKKPEKAEKKEGDGKTKEAAKPKRREAPEAEEQGDRAEPEKQRPKGEAAERVPEIETEPRIMPAARRALEQHGLRADEVDATGPGGRLLKEDVIRHVEHQEERMKGKERTAPAEPAEGREEEVVPLSPLRRRIAERLVAAQRNAALLTTFNEIDMSAVKRLRTEQGEAFKEKYGVKLGFMSFFVKAVVDALQQFPQLNAELREEGVAYRNYQDIGIAIGGGKGLVVPVLRDAARLSFAEIEQKIADFGERARRNALEVEELRGGTFTISNGGIYGSLLSTPIVNPPQSGVLGMHAIQDRPVAMNGEVAIRPMMYVALTYDHRLVDGREAVTFLKRIKEAVEEPARMLVEV
ncbi:MAG: 2-oxoglutarate dehydrogenase complex dihydrolipoyllysine-residue succinyltransferase [Planctomycetales bacterium]